MSPIRDKEMFKLGACLASDTWRHSGRGYFEFGLLTPSSESFPTAPARCSSSPGEPVQGACLQPSPCHAHFGILDARDTQHAPGTFSAHRWCPLPGPGQVPTASKGICCGLGLWFSFSPSRPWQGSSGPLILSGEVVMKSPSRPLDCVAGQVKGPFAPIQADVIPGNQFSAESCLHPGCLPACRLCPILFVMWGGLREGAEVRGDKVFSLPSENSVTPSRSLRRHLRLWGRLVLGSNPAFGTFLLGGC